jgi:hypothetical protein
LAVPSTPETKQEATSGYPGGSGAGSESGSGITSESSNFLQNIIAAVSRIRMITPGTIIPSENTIDWGGGKEMGRDNYYITEDSSPSKFGSSLGGLLQLDGDNLRNAILNAPWVKAVIPIRPGKEHAAINWLSVACGR